jgi:DNA processing protein
MLSEHEACVIMNMIPGIGIVRYRALVERAGSAAKALELPYHEVRSIKNIGEQLAAGFTAWRETVRWEDELTGASASGVRIITISDPEYPASLMNISDPPLCIYVRGEMPPEDKIIAIVGSRRMSAYGKRITEKIASQAAAAGWWVVSGLAYGIDAAAHKAVVEAGGRTAAVLGSGLARVHPQEHWQLAHDIVEKGGCLLSEYPLFNTVNRRTLPRRNRLISAFSQGVCVVEAGIGSGALITAAQALEQGRSVYAVPGHADNPGAAGSNGLIKNGEAMLVEDFSDIANDLTGAGNGNQVTAGTAEQQELFENGIAGEIIRFLRSNGQAGIDRIVAACNINVAEATAAIMKLELEDRIARLPGSVLTLK